MLYFDYINLKSQVLLKNILNKLPLDGIIVLDLTNVLSGPYATFILSELGASIIKVEKPGGDDSRNYGPFVDGKSGYFISLNRGKKSIVLDLSSKNDRSIFEKLLKKSDILIDNFKPGVLEKFGYSWNSLSRKFPKLIHGKISGFGETGPLKNLPAYDIVVQAMGGIMSITGSNKKNIVRVGTSIGDIVASLFCVIGILSQVIRRTKTARGSKLDLSMLDCQVAILENAISRFSINKVNPEPLGTDHPSISPFGSFKTKNGEIIIAIGNDKLFDVFCDVIRNQELKKNKSFNDNQKRNLNLVKLRKIIEKKLITRTTDHWIKVFSKKKIPCAKINNIKDVTNNKQIKSRKMILDYDHELTKSIKVLNSPFNFDFVRKGSKVKKAPELDENKKEILKYFDID